MEFTELTLKWWSTQHLPNDRLRKRHLLMEMDSIEIVYTIFNLERWSTQHLLMRDGNSKKWRSQPLFLRHGFHSLYSWDIVSTVYTNERCNNIIYEWEMEFTRFIHLRWGKQHLFFRVGKYSIVMRDGFHRMYSWEIGHTAFTHGRWRPRYLLMRYGVEGIYLWDMESTALTHERRSR